MPERRIKLNVNGEIRAIDAGRGRFADDVQLPGQLHIAFLRSDVIEAEIEPVSAVSTLEDAMPPVLRSFTLNWART